MRAQLRWLVHNLVAHPLLILCPPVGRFMHALTAATVAHPTASARHLEVFDRPSVDEGRVGSFR